MTNTIAAAKHYAKRDHQAQGAYYTNHVSAMTGEGLHSKSAIAAELAHRDMEIDRLRAALAAPAQAVPAPGAPSDPSITLDFKMATDLLEMFGGEPGLVTLQHGDERSHSGPGLYAFYSDMLEEGSGFLGADPDDEATPDTAASATAAPAQAGEYPELPIRFASYDAWGNQTKHGYNAEDMRAYADKTCAARGAAQAAPVDAENEIDLLAEAALCERLDACLAAALAAPTPPTRRSP